MSDDDRWNDLGDRFEDRGLKAAQRFESHPYRTFIKTCLALGAVILIGGVIFGAVSWISSWGGTAARLTGPAHSEQQVTAVLDDWQGLQATAGNACDAKSRNGGANDPQLVESPDFAYRAQYRRIKADYDRRNANLFEAYVTRHLPLPGSIQNLPRVAPTLSEAERAQGC